MSLINGYKKFRKGVLISLVLVEIVLSAFIYLESTAYFGVYDIIEISITFALIFYVFMLSNDLEDYENKEIKEGYIAKISPTMLIYINREGSLEILNGSYSSLGMPTNMNAKSFKALFSLKEWEKIENIVTKSTSKKQKTSGFISFLDNTGQLKYLYYVAQVAKRYKLDGLLVWLFDVSETKSQELNLTQLFHKYRVMSYELDLLINSLPIPTWKRGIDGKIIFCNQAYKDLIQKMGYNDSSGNIPEFNNFFYEELTKDDSEEISIKKVFIIDNQPVILRINEIKVSGEGSIGYCNFINEVEQLEKKVIALNNTLESLLKVDANALLIINNLGNVAFYNQAFITLFNLEQNSISSNLSFSSLIDKMREKGKLPEVKNYKEFKWQQMKYITEQTESEFFFMYLPDGKTLKVSVIPVQGGDTVFRYENIIEQLAMGRVYNEHINVLKTLVASYDYAAAILGHNGRLLICNDKFIKLFDFVDSPEEMHFMDMMLAQEKAFQSVDSYQNYKNALTSALDQRSNISIALQFQDKQKIEAKIEPLPDNSIMIKYINIV
ncbi:Sensor protein [endosymbiont of Acanthamoeba sp. UWC8]|uniref:PAS-domain containing protein n=1 Tax=endosymbiont of Acanthamoeba sp. UWC8 TaxID=86106 RepID=UPI0004D120D6|nr:PAS-domain containing protein [endosymbiont of Acanthamoeba sp. UWC8]AIF81131.1 Sensor protein [endosymbiont of Acanthamoeba sp. UWC8]